MTWIGASAPIPSAPGYCESIETVGVGGLVKMACEKGRAVAKDQKKAFKLGVCGEHGGDPASIGFFQKCGLDYVSCSPFRVPVARLAAALR